MIELRSYRRVFELERRIYRIDRLRLNPSGVPVRGIVYFLALVVIGVLAAAPPLVGAAARTVPWYVRALVGPALGAAVLALIRVDGRPFHLAAHALLRYGVTPRRNAGLGRRTSVGARWFPGEILMLPDGSDAHMRRLRYAGPGAVLVTVAHEQSVGRAAAPRCGFRGVPKLRSLTIRELASSERPGQGQVVVLARGGRLFTAGAVSRRIPSRARAGPPAAPRGWPTGAASG